MKQSVFIHECTLGGPGLDGYAYNADVWCVDCGRKIIRSIAKEIAPMLENTDDWRFTSSEHVPQPIFFGESDCKQYCADCDTYLYGESTETE